MARQTLHIPGKWHGDNPIALATKVGHIVTTSGVSGQNTDTGETPEDAEEQAKWAFEHVRRIMAAAGGSPDDISHVQILAKSRDVRAVLNVEWAKMFPDPDSRPTRHTAQTDALGGNMQFQLFITAYVE
jgi:2-iminobutanoate/2-iminopropanoate deaminase